MPLRRLGVFLERHHVHWAHRFQAILQLAAGIFFADEGVVFQPRNIFLHAKLGRLYAEVVDAGCLKVLEDRRRAWPRCTACRSRLTQCVCFRAKSLQLVFGFGQCGA